MLQMNFVASFGLRGVFVLAVNADDFSGRCDEGRYPLLTLINSKMSEMSSHLNQGEHR